MSSAVRSVDRNVILTLSSEPKVPHFTRREGKAAAGLWLVFLPDRVAPMVRPK